jgi:hypothetical protein
MHALVSFTALSLLIGSCSVFKPQKSAGILRDVAIQVVVYTPHCGGAKPTETYQMGFTEPLATKQFGLYRGTVYRDGMQPMQRITLNEQGNCALKLENGFYFLMDEEKALPLDEFIAKNSLENNPLYIRKEDSCFKEWQQTPDFYFQIESDTTILLQKNAKCWTGTNPCLGYIGPSAP